MPFGLPITLSFVYLSKDVKTYSRVQLNKTEKKDDGGSACINVDMVLSIFRAAQIEILHNVDTILNYIKLTVTAPHIYVCEVL